MSRWGGVRGACSAAAAVLVLGCGEGSATLGSASTTVVAANGASNPTVALARGDGATLVAWVATADGRSDVYFSRAAPGASFSAPTKVNDRPGDAAPHAQAPARVASGPRGQVYVAWQNNTVVEGRRFPASDLRFARSIDGGRSFEPAIYVNDDAGAAPTSHTFHDVAVAPDGTIYVSWIDGRARAGGGGAGDARAHGAATHHAGGDGGPQIRVARSTDGGRSFEPSRVVDDNACPCCRTAVAVGPDGAVYVAWRKQFDGSVRDIVVARSADGGETFAPPVRVHRDGWAIEACPHAGPALAVDPAGRVHVAWFTGADGRSGAYYATSGSGEVFGDPVPLTPAGTTPTTQVKMAADEQGSVWIAWEGIRGAGPVLRLGRADAAGEIQGIALEEPVPGMLPSVAAHAGRVAVAWLDGETVQVLRGTDAGR